MGIILNEFGEFYFSGQKGKIEHNLGDVYHIQSQGFRLELPSDDFKCLADILLQAKANFARNKEMGRRVSIPINEIQANMEEKQLPVDHKTTIENLFNLYNRKGISYAVLRGHMFLPHGLVRNGTGDIDVFIDESDFSKAILLAGQAGLSLKGKKTWLMPLYRLRDKAFWNPKIMYRWIKHRHVQDFMKPKCTTFNFKDIEIDLWNHVGHVSLLDKSIRRVDNALEQEMLKTRIFKNDLFYILSIDHELLHLINRVILDKQGDIPIYYQLRSLELIRKLVNNDSLIERFQRNLTKYYFGLAPTIWREISSKYCDLGKLRQVVLSNSDY